MFEIILFVVSAVVVIYFSLRAVAIIGHGEMNTPFPFLCNWGVSYTNTYISACSIGYQVYFWANHFNLFAQ